MPRSKAPVPVASVPQEGASRRECLAGRAPSLRGDFQRGQVQSCHRRRAQRVRRAARLIQQGEARVGDRTRCFANLDPRVGTVREAAHHSGDTLQSLLAVLGIMCLETHFGDQPLGGKANDRAHRQEHHARPVLTGGVGRSADQQWGRQEEHSHTRAHHAQFAPAPVQRGPKHRQQSHDRYARIRSTGGAAQKRNADQEDQRRENLPGTAQRALPRRQSDQAGQYAEAHGERVFPPVDVTRSHRCCDGGKCSRRRERRKVLRDPLARRSGLARLLFVSHTGVLGIFGRCLIVENVK